MMKIKEVQAGVKISRNYNSYQINLVADLELGESSEKVGEDLIERATEIINKKMGENLGGGNLKEKEVGAAWPHKKSANFLSVKMNNDLEYRDVRLLDLEKTDDGYKEGDLIYKEVKNRNNEKMPIYRIYKEVRHEK